VDYIKKIRDLVLIRIPSVLLPYFLGPPVHRPMQCFHVFFNIQQTPGSWLRISDNITGKIAAAATALMAYSSLGAYKVFKDASVYSLFERRALRRFKENPTYELELSTSDQFHAEKLIRDGIIECKQQIPNGPGDSVCHQWSVPEFLDKWI